MKFRASLRAKYLFCGILILAMSGAPHLFSQEARRRGRAPSNNAPSSGLVWDSTDPDYQSFFKHVPEDEFNAARKKTARKTGKTKAFEFEQIDYPTGMENPRVYRFDMGPASSPVKQGFTPIHKDDVFSWEKGYGWSTEAAEGDFSYRGKEDFDEQKNKDYGVVQILPLYDAFERHGKKLTDPWSDSVNWQLRPEQFKFYDDFLDDMSRDAVVDPEELAFKVALPNGRYWVSLVVGDLQIPRFAMEIYANGRRIAGDKYLAMVHHRGFSEPASPWVARVAFPVDVVRNNLRIALRPNENLYWERLETAAEPPDYTYTQLGGNKLLPPNERKSLSFWGKRMAMHGPATQMALAGLTVTPYERPPLELNRQRLLVAPAVEDESALEGVAKFNAGDVTGAEAAFDRIPDAETILKASGYMALAGLLTVELVDEPHYVQKALDVLEKGKKANPDDIRISELHTVVRFYDQGLYRMIHASEYPLNQVRMEAVALFQWVNPSEILYSKALSYIGRCYAQTDPHRWVTSWYLAEEAFLELEERDPGNRVSGYYLYGSMDGWDFTDYSKDVQGAPKWAAMMYEVYNRLIDQAEWWGDNRQLPDGRLGGGWGDDVEIGIVWEAVAMVNPDVSKKFREVVEALAEGVWWSGDIDRDAGFFDGMADVEHTAEWTADSQPFMMAVDYGNPIYFERCLKTAKLMRDIWTGVNDHGHRHFKSMMLGNDRVSTNAGNYTMDAEIDHPLNGRAASPGYWAWWYSNGDAVDRIFSEWASAWLEDCERAENGKPAWAIPGPIGYHTDVIGGNHATVWRAGSPKGNTYTNPAYVSYIQSLCARMYLKTGDEKWLMPRAVKISNKGEVQGTGDPIRNPLELKAVQDKYELFDRGLGLETIIGLMRDNWPSLTSEVASTDRIAPTGILSVLELLTGGDLLGGMDFIPVTFEKTSRKVAFLTIGSSPTSAKILLYNFAEEEESVGVRFWTLEIGGEYRAAIGVDENDDDKSDQPLEESTFVHEHRADAIYFGIPPRKAIVVDVQQLKPGERRPGRLSDLAVANRDIQYADGKLSVTIHNIGNEKSGTFDCVVWEGKVGAGKKLAELAIDELEAPNDLEPRRVVKTIDWKLPRSASIESPVTIAVQLDSMQRNNEITEKNNQASRAFPYVQKAYMVPRMWPDIAEQHGGKRGDPFPPGVPVR